MRVRMDFVMVETAADALSALTSNERGEHVPLRKQLVTVLSLRGVERAPAPLPASDRSQW